MGDKVRALHQGDLMDIFYNHLSAFSADSLPHHSSGVGNKKEMTGFLSRQETSIKMEYMQVYLPVKVPRKGESGELEQPGENSMDQPCGWRTGQRKRMYPVGIQALVRDPWEVKLHGEQTHC